jgi:hypothetical protein
LAPFTAVLNLERRPAGLQEFPVQQQFRMMDFGSGLDKALLSPRKLAADAFDRIQRERGKRVLIQRVKMRPVVGSADFHEHPNDDSEEPRQLRHGPTLHRRFRVSPVMAFVGPTTGL